MTRRLSVTTLVATSALLVALAGCGGSSGPVPGHDLAAKACQSGGSTAATLAAQAAQANSVYATLSADEASQAATESGEAAEQADPNDPSSGVGSLSDEENLGSTSSIAVLTGCTKLGLPIAAKH
jgi:hypothetical protein